MLKGTPAACPPAISFYEAKYRLATAAVVASDVTTAIEVWLYVLGTWQASALREAAVADGSEAVGGVRTIDEDVITHSVDRHHGACVGRTGSQCDDGEGSECKFLNHDLSPVCVLL